jgi:hypothetical protein
VVATGGSGAHQMKVWISGLRMIDNLGNLISVNEGYDSSQVELDDVSGINDAVPSVIHIIPNPAKDKVVVTVSDDLIGGELKLVDINGKLLSTVPIQSANCQLSTANHPEGIYFVQIVIGNGTKTRRLSISR